MKSSIRSLFQSCNYNDINKDYFTELDERIKLIEKAKNIIQKQAENLKVHINKLSEKVIGKLEQHIKYYSDLKKKPPSERKKFNLTRSRLSLTSNLCINTKKIEEFFYQDFIIEEDLSKTNPNNLDLMSPQDLKKELENKYNLPLTGHTGSITSLVIFPDNDHFITCSHDKTIRLWSLKNESQDHIFYGHTGIIWNVSLNFSSRLLVSSSADHTVKIWNIEEKCLLFTKTGHIDEVNTAVLTKDNRIVSGSDDNTVRIWNLYSDNEIGIINTDSGVLALTITEDAQRVVLGCKDQTIKVLNLTSMKKEFEFGGHTNWVRSVALSKDNSTIVSGGFDSLVNVYSFSERVMKNSISASSNVCSVSFSSDQNYILAGISSGTLDVISLERSNIEFSLNEHTNRIKTAEMSSDGTFIITGSDDNSFIIWDTKTRTKKNVIMYENEPLNFLGATSDLKYVFIGSENGLVNLLDLEKKKCIEKYKGFKGAIEVKFSSNRKYMVFADREFRFKICFATEKAKRLLAPYEKGLKDRILVI
ncbi:hypothetical protein SteCoe_27376 [Stentor coeruleus]|uniref:Uncharacterized protein n=1 Tax=Stentor coeruleus TaxID=5963 RepID=A0A1R2BB81_9CILI|nr:hypothetical protein SteCoe_27376 [Stentor coeruleus]